MRPTPFFKRPLIACVVALAFFFSRNSSGEEKSRGSTSIKLECVEHKHPVPAPSLPFTELIRISAPNCKEHGDLVNKKREEYAEIVNKIRETAAKIQRTAVAKSDNARTAIDAAKRMMEEAATEYRNLAKRSGEMAQELEQKRKPNEEMIKKLHERHKELQRMQGEHEPAQNRDLMAKRKLLQQVANTKTDDPELAKLQQQLQQLDARMKERDEKFIQPLKDVVSNERHPRAIHDQSKVVVTSRAMQKELLAIQRQTTEKAAHVESEKAQLAAINLNSERDLRAVEQRIAQGKLVTPPTDRPEERPGFWSRTRSAVGGMFDASDRVDETVSGKEDAVRSAIRAASGEAPPASTDSPTAAPVPGEKSGTSKEKLKDVFGTFGGSDMQEQAALGAEHLTAVVDPNASAERNVLETQRKATADKIAALETDRAALGSPEGAVTAVRTAATEIHSVDQKIDETQRRLTPPITMDGMPTDLNWRADPKDQAELERLVRERNEVVERHCKNDVVCYSLEKGGVARSLETRDVREGFDQTTSLRRELENPAELARTLEAQHEKRLAAMHGNVQTLERRVEGHEALREYDARVARTSAELGLVRPGPTHFTDLNQREVIGLAPAAAGAVALDERTSPDDKALMVRAVKTRDDQAGVANFASLFGGPSAAHQAWIDWDTAENTRHLINDPKAAKILAEAESNFKFEAGMATGGAILTGATGSMVKEAIVVVRTEQAAFTRSLAAAARADAAITVGDNLVPAAARWGDETYTVAHAAYAPTEPVVQRTLADASPVVHEEVLAATRIEAPREVPPALREEVRASGEVPPTTVDLAKQETREPTSLWRRFWSSEETPPRTPTPEPTHVADAQPREAPRAAVAANPPDERPWYQKIFSRSEESPPVESPTHIPQVSPKNEGQQLAALPAPTHFSPSPSPAPVIESAAPSAVRRQSSEIAIAQTPASPVRAPAETFHNAASQTAKAEPASTGKLAPSHEPQTTSHQGPSRELVSSSERAPPSQASHAPESYAGPEVSKPSQGLPQKAAEIKSVRGLESPAREENQYIVNGAGGMRPQNFESVQARVHPQKIEEASRIPVRQEDPAILRSASSRAPSSPISDLSETELRRENLRKALVDRGYAYREVEVNLPTLNGDLHQVRMFEIKASPREEWLGKVTSNLDQKHGIDVRLYDFPDGRGGFSAVSAENMRPYVALNGADFLDGARKPVVVHEITHAVRTNPSVEAIKLEAELAKANRALKETPEPWFFERWFGTERFKNFEAAQARVEHAQARIAAGQSERTALARISAVRKDGQSFTFDELEANSKGARSSLAMMKDLEAKTEGARETLSALHVEAKAQHQAYQAFSEESGILLKQVEEALSKGEKLEISGKEVSILVGRGTEKETKLTFELAKAFDEAEARKQVQGLVRQSLDAVARLDKLSPDTAKQIESMSRLVPKDVADSFGNVRAIRIAEENLTEARAVAAKIEKPAFWKRWTDPVAFGKYKNAQEALDAAEKNYLKVSSGPNSSPLLSLKPLGIAREDDAVVRVSVQKKSFESIDAVERQQKIESRLFEGLNELDLPAGKKIDLTFAPDLEKGELAIRSRSLEHGDLEKLSKLLTRNDLPHLLMSQPLEQAGRALRVTVEGTDAGKIAVRELEFSHSVFAEKVLHLKDDEVGMFGYGSLLNQKSMESTLGRELTHTPIDTNLKGWKRTWDVSMPNEMFHAEIDGARITPERVAYLNIRPVPGEHLNGTLFVIKKSELPSFHTREWIYDPVDLSGQFRGLRVEGGQVFGYVGKPQYLVAPRETFPKVGVRESYIGIVDNALAKKDPAYQKAYRASTDPVPAHTFADQRDLSKRPMNEPLIGSAPEVPGKIRSTADSRIPSSVEVHAANFEQLLLKNPINHIAVEKAMGKAVGDLPLVATKPGATTMDAVHSKMNARFPGKNVELIAPGTAPMSGNQVFLVKVDGKVEEVVKLYSSTSGGFGREMAGLKAMQDLKPEKFGVTQVNDVFRVQEHGRNIPVMVMKAAEGKDAKTTFAKLLKSPEPESARSAIQNASQAGEALGELHAKSIRKFEVTKSAKAYREFELGRAEVGLRDISSSRYVDKGWMTNAERELLARKGATQLKTFEDATGPVSLIHGDFHSGNIFLHEGKATIIDVESITSSVRRSADGKPLGTGDPLADVGRFIESIHLNNAIEGGSKVTAKEVERSFLEAYSKSTGIPLSEIRKGIEFHKLRFDIVNLRMGSHLGEEASRVALDHTLKRLGIRAEGAPLTKIIENTAPLQARAPPTPAEMRQWNKVEWLRKNQKEFTAIGESDNIAFKQLAVAANSGQPSNVKVAAILESAVTKELNDVVIKDKDLVTALLNLQKDVVWGPISRDPDLSKHLIGKYSDFKSMKFAFDSNAPVIERRLKEIFKDFNARYSEFLDNVAKKEGWSEAKGLLAGKRENWHHMGIGSTPDEANWAARQSRTMLDARGLASPRTFREIKEQAAQDLRAIQARRIELSEKFGKINGMFVDAGDGKKILSAEANETIRKAKPEAVKQALETRFRHSFSDADIAAFKDYVNKADAVSPDLYLDKRVLIPLGERRNGIISADFKGQNARNLEETMRAMALHEGKSLPEQMRAIRAGEEAATAVLDAKKAKFREAVMKLDPESEKHIYFSGDDGIYLPPRQLTEAEKRQLLNTVSDGPDELRLTYNLSSYADNGSHIPEIALSKYVGEAEEVEKDLRKKMIDSFPREQMNRVQIVVDMEPISSGGKKVGIYLGGQNAPAETKAMQEWVGKHLEKQGFERKFVEVMPAKSADRIPASMGIAIEETPKIIRSTADSRAKPSLSDLKKQGDNPEGFVKQSGGIYDLKPQARMEGSIDQGGMQPHYLADWENPKLSKLRSFAEEIGKSQAPVEEKIRQITSFIQQKVLPRGAYDDPGYLKLLEKYRNAGKDIPLSAYMTCKAGVCRENALYMHYALKNAGIENQFVYAKVQQKVFDGPRVRFDGTEDHAFTIVKIKGENFIVDSYNSNFHGFSFDQLQRKNLSRETHLKTASFAENDPNVFRRVVEINKFPVVYQPVPKAPLLEETPKIIRSTPDSRAGETNSRNFGKVTPDIVADLAAAKTNLAAVEKPWFWKKWTDPVAYGKFENAKAAVQSAEERFQKSGLESRSVASRGEHQTKSVSDFLTTHPLSAAERGQLAKEFVKSWEENKLATNNLLRLTHSIGMSPSDLGIAYRPTVLLEQVKMRLADSWKSLKFEVTNRARNIRSRLDELELPLLKKNEESSRLPASERASVTTEKTGVPDSRFAPVQRSEVIHQRDLIATSEKWKKEMRDLGVDATPRADTHSVAKMMVDEKVSRLELGNAGELPYYGEVLKINKTPSTLDRNPGPMSRALTHPDLPAEFKKMKELGYDLVVDTSVHYAGLSAYFNPVGRVLAISPNTPWKDFLHEFQHLEFQEHLLNNRNLLGMTVLRMFGKDLNTALSPSVLEKIGRDKVAKIQTLLDRGITPQIAINESLSIMKEFEALGWRRYLPNSPGTQSYKYMLRHQITELEKLGTSMTQQQLDLVTWNKAMHTLVDKYDRLPAQAKAAAEKTRGAYIAAKAYHQISEEYSTVYYDDSGNIFAIKRDGSIDFIQLSSQQ